MKVSIVTVCYNSDATIERAIESVLAQSYTDIEYIVIDGGSTDNTDSIIEKYRDSLAYYLSENDSGIYDAMNKGIKQCTGEIVGILNSDDAYTSNFEIEHIVQKFIENPNSEIVIGDIKFVNFETGKTLRTYSAKQFKPYKMRFGWMPPHPATFVKKSVYEMYGLYSTKYKISADFERLVKWLLVEKTPYSYTDRCIVNMSIGGASTANLKSVITLNKEVIKACRTNGIYTNILMICLKFPFKLLELVRR